MNNYFLTTYLNDDDNLWYATCQGFPFYIAYGETELEAITELMLVFCEGEENEEKRKF